MRFDTIHR